jgi:epoxyqueuosine reductase
MDASMKDVDRRALTRFAKDEALRLGFAFAGVTTPDPPPHLEVYRRWLAAGRHGEMGYLARDRAVARREDPRRILPECRSILVVAAPYDPAPPSSRLGQVAAYARGPDYHEVLIERLGGLMAALEEHLARPFAFRLYTDTGPILERELAQRAGLGWIGKNTCLIHPRQGSYLLLAEALLDLELEPDAPFTADHCGTCTRCLDACPTSCILPDRTIDARRCISYLTIEVKGAIEPELRPAVGNWLFGCDICQQVCPWNVRFAPPQAIPSTHGGPVDAHDVLEGEGLMEQLRGSALHRAGRTGLTRNAVIVAGNAAAADLVPALIRRLRDDSDAVVRAHAAWALGRIGDVVSRQALAEALPVEQDPTTKAEIEAALK